MVWLHDRTAMRKLYVCMPICDVRYTICIHCNQEIEMLARLHFRAAKLYDFVPHPSIRVSGDDGVSCSLLQYHGEAQTRGHARLTDVLIG